MWFWPEEAADYTGSLKIFSDTIEPAHRPLFWSSSWVRPLTFVGTAIHRQSRCAYQVVSTYVTMHRANCENGTCRYVAILQECDGRCEILNGEPTCVPEPDGGIIWVQPEIDAGNGATVTVGPWMLACQRQSPIPVRLPEPPCPDTDTDEFVMMRTVVPRFITQIKLILIMTA